MKIGRIYHHICSVVGSLGVKKYYSDYHSEKNGFLYAWWIFLAKFLEYEFANPISSRTNLLFFRKACSIIILYLEKKLHSLSTLLIFNQTLNGWWSEGFWLKINIIVLLADHVDWNLKSSDFGHRYWAKQQYNVESKFFFGADYTFSTYKGL